MTASAEHRGGHEGPDGPDAPATTETTATTEIPAATATTATSGPADAPGTGASGPRRRRAPLVAGVVGAVLLLGYGAAVAATASAVPRGTTVAGVDLGGLSRDAAPEALAAGLAARTSGELAVDVAGAADAVDPAAAGLGLDAGASVDAAAGAPASPVTLWHHLVGGGADEAVTTVDEVALEAALTALAGRTTVPAVEGGVDFTGAEPVAVQPVAGTALDVPAAEQVIARGWLVAAPPLELPTAAQEPEVGADEVAAVLDGFARPALAGPLVVLVGEREVEVPVAALAPLLSTAVEDGALVGRVDGAGLVAAVLAVAPDAVTAPQDARVEIADGAPRVVPAVLGTTVRPDPLGVAAATALTGDVGSPERRVVAELDESEPEVTTADAEALGIVEVISSFDTTLTPDAPRTENITIAARAVDGTVLLPGDTFSLNGILGERTPQKGYNQAGVISGGKLTKDYGGGVSQLATTLFNGMFFAGLQDVEHKAHSLYFSRYPEGREATVDFPSVDLAFTNDSGHGVLVEAWVSGGQVHTRFWGTKVYDVEASRSPRRNVRTPETVEESGSGCKAQSPITGFDVTVTRTFLQGGRVVRTEDFRTSYNSLDGVRCVQPPVETVDPAEVAPEIAAEG